ncbi:hypothetical protein J437_LFUL008659, partial [Ladona fulva]
LIKSYGCHVTPGVKPVSNQHLRKGSANQSQEVSLNGPDQKLIYLLAYQRLQQLVPQEKSTKAEDDVKDSVQAMLSTLSSALISQETPSESSVPPFPPSAPVWARAVICPLVGGSPVTAMPYRTLTIGTGADMDVCLSNYGHCNFISAKHASIFYDEITKHYELINYSEHGTTVDNVLYSCDFSEKTPVTVEKAPQTLLCKGREAVNNSRNLYKRKLKTFKFSTPEREAPSTGTSTRGSSANQKQVPRPPNRYTISVNNEESASTKTKEEKDKKGNIKHETDSMTKAAMERMSSKAGKNFQRCGCRTSSSLLISGNGAGWEGTALLNHGSCIKFGCLQFVFSITDFATVPPNDNVADQNSSSSSNPSSTSSSTKTLSSPMTTSNHSRESPPSSS